MKATSMSEGRSCLSICLNNKICYLWLNNAGGGSMENNVCIREKADPVQIKRGREFLLSNRAAFTQLSAVLSLAGNGGRLKILYLLGEGKEICACDLSDMLGMSIPAVSQHLWKVEGGDIVQFPEERAKVFYSLKK